MEPSLRTAVDELAGGPRKASEFVRLLVAERIAGKAAPSLVRPEAGYVAPETVAGATPTRDKDGYIRRERMKNSKELEMLMKHMSRAKAEDLLRKRTETG